MAANDVVLLDALVTQAKSRLGANRSDDEIFELFCLEQILKEYSLSHEDLEAGWVDGGRDGGIDGFYTFLDDHLVTSDDIPEAHKHRPHIHVLVCTIKHRNTFQQAPLDQLHTSLAELLDLSKSDTDLLYPYNNSIIEARSCFRQALLQSADKKFKFTIKIVFASRGDSAQTGPDLQARAKAIEGLIPSLIRETDACRVEFIGASQLLDFARRRPDYSIKLPFIESVLSRGRTNYALLCRLFDYYKFVSAEDGSLRRYLFESNVRDYLGTKGAVNRDIAATLAERNTSEEFTDFWWLNNGVTLLASHASTVGKEINLENVQIVNGLQTTETIHRWFSELCHQDRTSEASADDRAILVKIIVTENREVLDRIIKASNYQSPVDTASLRATDKIQRDIEAFFEQSDFYYERRNNYWYNHNKPVERIVTPRHLAGCVRAVALCDPLGSISSRSGVFRNDQIYQRVFDTSWSLDVFLNCLRIVKNIERIGRTASIPVPEYNPSHLTITRLFASYLYVALFHYSWVVQNGEPKKY